MAAPVKNMGSGAEFNQVPFISNALMDIPGFKGCCGGFMKFSYVISAPLHMKGFWEFWASETSTWADKLASSVDLLVHLALWFTALGLEIWCCLEKNRGHEMLQELQTSSLWALIVALCGIVIAQIFAMTAGGQEAGKLFPTTYAAIVGGAYASILFSVLYYQMALTAVPGFVDTDDDAHNEMAQLRKQTLWTLALKFFAVTTLKQNAAFWGPCKVEKPMAMEMAEPKAALSLGVTTKA